ncbi:MAG: pilus assembly protein [Candidatus Melainabacteria bacterium]|nr:pilus assembly protein [Candidatus Melainabacteria bacterium]
MLLNNYSIKRKRSLEGSVIVEAAIVIPILVAITFFIIEFGIVLYLTNSLNQIARSAARYASVTPSYTNQGLIDASGASKLVPSISALTLTVTPAPGAAVSVGTTITVNVKYAYTPIINPFGLIGSKSSWAPTINSVSIARSEVSNAS